MKWLVLMIVFLFGSCSTKEKPAEFKPTYNHNNQYSMRIMGVVPQRLRPYIKTITVTSTYIAHSSKCYVTANSWEGVKYPAEKIYHKTFSVDSRSGKFDGKVYTDLVTPQDKCQWGLSTIGYQFNGASKNIIAFFSLNGDPNASTKSYEFFKCYKYMPNFSCRPLYGGEYSKKGSNPVKRNYIYQIKFDKKLAPKFGFES